MLLLEEEERLRSEFEAKEREIKAQTEEEIKQLKTKLQKYGERGLHFLSIFIHTHKTHIKHTLNTYTQNTY
jgi:hypothetical protein